MASAAAGAFILAACSSGGSNSGSGRSSEEITISGSSTVEPISALNAEKFQEAQGDLAISVDGPGTGDGFELFCSDQSDISDASRPIQDEEKKNCKANGVDWVELKIAIDGLSVITSNNNADVTCLGNADLYALVGPESTGFDKWSSADKLAKEIKATHAPYEDSSLVITAPGEESGTYDSFVELVIEKIAEERGEEPATRPDYTASPNDNVIIEAIAGDDTSLGWVGYAYFVETAGSVKAIQYEGDDGTCVEPTPETIGDGSYGLSRPLYLYVNTGRATENAKLSKFVDFFLSDAGIASVSEAGYVELGSDELAATRQAWESSKTTS